MAQFTAPPPIRHYSCPDCPRGGERWTTAGELTIHLVDVHPDLWTPEQILDETAEQARVLEASR